MIGNTWKVYSPIIYRVWQAELMVIRGKPVNLSAMGYESDGISLTRQEAEKMSQITPYSALQQCLHGTWVFKILTPL